MGCGQSSHFEGEGQTLGGGAANNKTKTPKKSNNSMNSTPPSTINNRTTKPIAGELERRAAILNAAEERAKKGANRGAVPGGKLSAALAAMPADGGRRTEALEAGKGKDSAPLVWD